MKPRVYEDDPRSSVATIVGRWLTLIPLVVELWFLDVFVEPLTGDWRCWVRWKRHSWRLVDRDVEGFDIFATYRCRACGAVRNEIESTFGE